ncbi:hypothetical protein KW794_03135 [Candidatus Saccharibacteria bacterium]|nr:hypothetical protein [Candidatus Saccharibacteria bacterium]
MVRRVSRKNNANELIFVIAVLILIIVGYWFVKDAARVNDTGNIVIGSLILVISGGIIGRLLSERDKR